MNQPDRALLLSVRQMVGHNMIGKMMSFAKITTAAFAGLLLCSTAAFAQVGGGTELPSNAEPNRAKDSTEKSMDKGSMQKGDSMKKEGSMEKGGSMEKKSGDKM